MIDHDIEPDDIGLADPPMIDTPGVREAARAILEVLSYNAVGGNLHIMVHDSDFEDESVAFCRDAIERNVHEIPPEGIDAERRCLDLLATLTPDERESAQGMAWGSWGPLNDIRAYARTLHDPAAEAVGITAYLCPWSYRYLLVEVLLGFYRGVEIYGENPKTDGPMVSFDRARVEANPRLVQGDGLSTVLLRRIVEADRAMARNAWSEPSCRYCGASGPSHRRDCPWGMAAEHLGRGKGR